MKQMIRLSALMVALGGVAFISACGADADPGAMFATSLDEVVALVTTSAGLKDPKVAAIFDDAYKDGGYVKSALIADFLAESATLAANPDESLFPMASFKDITVSGCDSDICILAGKLINIDVDTTEANFTTRVKRVNGIYYFYGDQQAS